MLKLTVSYDGTDFAGSQIQPGARTVQGDVEQALRQLGFPAERATFASRTDRGVHAAGQIATCVDERPTRPLAAVQRAINSQLAPDLAVGAVERVADDFHPRYDALWREYRYRILSGDEAPLARSMVWQRRQALDPARMSAAALAFEGRRDFAAVAGGGDGVPWAASRLGARGTVRTVFACTIREIVPWWAAIAGALYELRIVADGFLPRMVRNIVEIVVRAGRGALEPSAVATILGQCDRRTGLGTAPAHGLTLWRIGYREWAGGQPEDIEPHDRSPR